MLEKLIYAAAGFATGMIIAFLYYEDQISKLKEKIGDMMLDNLLKEMNENSEEE